MKQLKNLFDEKLLKFILVGVVNTLVGMAIMFGLYNLAHCSAPLCREYCGVLWPGIRHRQAAVSAAFGERQCRGT